MKRFAAWLLIAALFMGSPGVLAAPAGGDRAPKETVRAVVLLERAPLTEARTSVSPDRAELFSETDYTAQLAEEKAELFSAIEDEGVSFEVVYTFDTLVNGFSCDVAYGDLDALARLPGVKSVHIADTYAAPDPAEPGITPHMTNSNAVTGSDLTIQAGYTGRGTVVAVLDSGVNLEHEAFQVYDDVLGTPKLTETAVNELVTGETVAAGQYISEKIPFGYDYFDRDNDPTDEGTEDSARGHGSHVSGIAVGYVEDGEGNVTFSGTAPGAQLLAMKIYPSNGKGTSTDVYFKALEDALKLGADVVNLSLGVDNGFTHDPVLETELGGVFTRLEEAGVLVCASAGNSNSQAVHSTKGYIDPLNTDYAIVGSPSTYANNISVASMNNHTAPTGEGVAEAAALATTAVGTMSDFSSWGPTPSLTLRPTITSIGGDVNSAYWEGTNQYIVQGGTSMAAPNLAGTYAGLLSFLAAEPDGDSLTKKARAGLARSLMESTAQVVVSGEAAVPYSPRKQGTGLANSALARKAYASGWLENPIQELGDSAEGVFTFNFTVKNNSDAAITYKTSAVVLTDSATEVDGHLENAMTANCLFDSTEGADALGLATVTMDGEVTIAAHSEQAVPVTVTLTENGKKYFPDNGFWNGGFVEGYFFLAPTAESPDAATLHATMLGYYGDWAQVPAAEVQDFRSYLAAEYAYRTAQDNTDKTVYDYLAQPITTDVNVAYVNSSTKGNLYMLGSNLMSGYTGEGESFRGEVQYAPYHSAHVTLSANRENCGYEWLYTQPSLLRNVRFIVMDVTDSEGTLRSVDYQPEPSGPHNNNYVSRAYYGEDHCWHNSSSNQWYVQGEDGETLHADLRVILPYGADTEHPYGTTQAHIWKTLKGYDETTGEPIYEAGFDFTIDSTAPEILSAEYRAGEEGGDGTLAVTVKDTHLAGVYLEENDVLVDYKIFDENKAVLNEDESWTATFSIPAGIEVTAGNVVAYDYAFNKTAQTAAYEETQTPDPGPTGDPSPSPSPSESPEPSESPSPSPSESPEPSESPSPSPSTNPGGSGGSGGGGGGGSAPATPPAAPTTVTTRADGAKVTTMNNSDGSVVETVEQTDGTKTEKVTAPNKDVTITVTGKNGETLVKAELPAVVPAVEDRFDDVPTDHWANEAIHRAAALELVKGVGGTGVNLYHMNDNMTRGSLATVLCRLSQGKTDYDGTFRDVTADKYYTEGVAWAVKANVVKGISEDLFAPDDTITREQLAVMLWRYAKLLGLDVRADGKALEGFTDGEATGAWAADGVAWCVEKGILKGKGQNDLDPAANVTRAEAAMMLDRFLELLK